MKYILRATRYITALIVSLHVSCLRGSVKLADRKATKCCKATEQARDGLRFAQEAVRYARQNVRDFRNIEITAGNDARNTRVAAEGEAKFWGRDL